MKKLTRKAIRAAQKSWASGILAIGEAYRKNHDYTSVAQDFIYTHYGYQEGMVLFKPTLASVEQFRETFEKALSYFISGNPKFPEDRGFAIQPWQKVKFQNVGFLRMGRRAIAMGNYYFSDNTGKEIKVEYTLGYFLNKKGEVKIYLHHSSIPYSSK